MGFLNHATNNIIVDAVLTEKGREVLARNDGSFDIQNFRLGDDEIDYSILEQYGIVIGKEKIEKNTPIFEAVTNEKLALKYPLRTFTTNNTEDIFAVPYLILDSTVVTPISLTSNINSNREIEKAIVVKTFLDQDEGFVLSDESLIDSSFTIKVSTDDVLVGWTFLIKYMLSYVGLSLNLSHIFFISNFQFDKIDNLPYFDVSKSAIILSATSFWNIRTKFSNQNFSSMFITHFERISVEIL